MKIILLIIAVAHTAVCGNVGGRTSVLSPAGVTYVDGSYHAGLAAGPVGYSTSGYSSAPVGAVAAEYSSAPVATVSAAPAVYASAPAGYSAGVAPVATLSASPNVYASAPAVAAAPIAYSAPATKYAAVPTVHQVPAVADIPVTRINAQPGVLQKTFDVARPAIKTQRYEVRRPAIQKQFYDIEERVVVRPAGSAVVELDEPLSKTQKGPSVIQAAGGSTSVTSQSVVVPTGPGGSEETSGGYSGSGSSVSVLPPAPPSQTVPHSAPVYASQAAVSPAAPVHSAPVQPAPIHSVSVSAPVQSAPVQPTYVHSAPVSAPIQPAPIHSVSSPVQSAPIHSVSGPVQTVSGVSTVSAGSSGHNSYPSLSSEVSFSTPAPHFSDDSVSVENADFNLARSNQLSGSGYHTVAFSAQGHGSSGLDRTIYQPQPVAHQTYASPAPAAVSAPAPAPVPQQKDVIFRSAAPTGRYSGHIQSAPVQPVASYTFVPQQKFSAPAFYSDGSAQSQINHENQRNFIQLLTARGGVAEIGRSGTAQSYPGQAASVRGRVLSATPAPAYAAPTGERVNTRRVVVSRPIETLQEVEVSEPVTKYERVQVSQPTVIKTASQDVVRVPTSVSVYGKAFAPVAEASYAAPVPHWQ